MNLRHKTDFVSDGRQPLSVVTPSLSTPEQQGMNWNNQLTVDRKWKVEQELAEKLSQQSRPSKIVPVVKWLVTILLASAITCLFIATKLSFIALSLALNMTAPSAPPDNKNTVSWIRILSLFNYKYVIHVWKSFVLILVLTFSLQNNTTRVARSCR